MMQYEPAGARDKSLLFFLAKENVEQYEDLHAMRLAPALVQIRDKIEAHIEEYTAIWQGKTKVGYFYLHRDGDGWEWEDFYLFPEYRGQGIGTQVLRERLPGQTDPVFLYVFLRNTRAIALYRRFGFKVTQTLRGSLHRMDRPAIRLLSEVPASRTAGQEDAFEPALHLCRQREYTGKV